MSAAVMVRFDRGTLLVECKAGVHLRGLPLVRHDPRVGRARAPAFGHAGLVAALRQRGHRVEDRVEAEFLGGTPVQAPSLRPYQVDALTAWRLAGRRGIVVLPTGAGKTRLAVAAIAQSRVGTLVLVPTRVLLDQWRAELSKYCGRAIGQLGDGCRTIAPITVATFESGLRHMDTLGAKFRMLVIDEAHHFAAGRRIETLEMSAAPLRLGLTATPPDDDERLAELVGPIVFRRSVADLAGEYLAPYVVERIAVDLTPAERVAYDESYGAFAATYRELRRQGLAESWQAFLRSAAGSVPGRRALAGFHAGRRIVGRAAKKLALVGELLQRHRDDRALVFTADNHAAYAISRAGLVPAITKDIRRTEREGIMDRFRSGVVRSIVSSRVLNEGVDIPEVGIGIVVGGVQGGREHVQRVGRLLRPRAGKRAIVYEIVVRNTFEVAQAARRRRALAA